MNAPRIRERRSRAASRDAGLGQTTPLQHPEALEHLGVIVLAALGVTWLRQRKP